ncbi:major facilitator superfamily domain-containing protein [Entophlyctis helioformis]|nr:major facilitator superfamily domain-containing protein [Entophlyctis helioformis]
MCTTNKTNKRHPQSALMALLATITTKNAFVDGCTNIHIHTYTRTYIHELACRQHSRMTHIDSRHPRHTAAHHHDTVRRHRWAILYLSSSLLFGVYYAYDLPASLSASLQTHLRLAAPDFAVHLQLMYTTYAAPNIVLPWVGGLLADRYGLHAVLGGCVVLVVAGQLLVAVGVQTVDVWLLHSGRFVFGLGGEILGVLQSAITSRWFRATAVLGGGGGGGGELALAMGINLSVSRLGSVFNDVVSPYLAARVGVAGAVWMGVVVCTVSATCAWSLVWMDRLWYAGSARTDWTPVDSSDGYTNDPMGSKEEEYLGLGAGVGLLGGSDDEEEEDEEDKERGDVARTWTAGRARGRGRGRSEAADRVLDMDATNARGGRSINRGIGASIRSRSPSSNRAVSPSPRSATRSPRLPSPLRHDPPPPSPPPTRSSSPSLQRLPLRFWLIVLILCLLYATVVPFNAIHAALLQTKWYPRQPQKSAQMMGIPDTISALLVPAIGTLVDNYGSRCKLLILCAGLLTASHTYFAVSTGMASGRDAGSAVPALVGLGVSYALLLTFWPAIPLVVSDAQAATAFGVATSLLNLCQALFPIVVATLVSTDPTYHSAELFFVACGVAGGCVGGVLYVLDQLAHGGALEMGLRSRRRSPGAGGSLAIQMA